MSDTLVLSAGFEPINQVTWRRAWTLWLKGKVQILEEYADRYINACGFKWPMPAVVRLVKAFVGKKRGVRFSRENVYARDKGRCGYCGQHVPRSEFTYDHVLPRDLGGKTRWENVVVACLPCNQRKRNRTPEQAGMRLLVAPDKPRSLPDTCRLKFGNKVPSEWAPYLRDMAYWHAPLEET